MSPDREDVENDFCLLIHLLLTSLSFHSYAVQENKPPDTVRTHLLHDHALLCSPQGSVTPAWVNALSCSLGLQLQCLPLRRMPLVLAVVCHGHTSWPCFIASLTHCSEHPRSSFNQKYYLLPPWGLPTCCSLCSWIFAWLPSLCHFVLSQNVTSSERSSLIT